MNGLDVDPVESIDDESAEIRVGVTDDLAEPDAPEYVLYGGKGGVGKTTMAAATALSSALAGTPTLVVSTDPAHSLSDTLATDVPAEPTRVRGDCPLYAAEIDPDAAMAAGPFGDADRSEGEATVGDENPLGGLGAMGEAMADMNPTMGGTMPGADEAAAMRQLLEYLDDPRFDRVVVDTAPTGHTLRLLELPEMLDSMVGKFLSMREKFGGVMDGLKGMVGMGGDGASGPDLDELKARIGRLRAVLTDPSQTDFRVVMIPEEMSVVESERLVDRLGEYEIPVQTLVVNRVMEDLADVADVEALGDGDGESAAEDDDLVVSPSLDTCEFCQRRWQVQKRALSRATDLFRGRDVKRVPLLAEEVRGESALRVVAACLA